MLRSSASGFLAVALATLAPGARAGDGPSTELSAHLREHLVARGDSPRRGRFRLRIRGTTTTAPESSISLRLGDVAIDVPLVRGRSSRKSVSPRHGIRSRVTSRSGRIVIDVSGSLDGENGNSALAARVLGQCVTRYVLEDDAAPHGLFAADVTLDGVRTPIVVGVAARLRTRFGDAGPPRHSLSLTAAGISLADANAAPVVAILPSPEGAWDGRVRGFALARDSAPAVSLAAPPARARELAPEDSEGAIEVGEGTLVADGISSLVLAEGTVFQSRFDAAVLAGPGSHDLVVHAVDGAGRSGRQRRAVGMPVADPPLVVDANGQILEIREGGALWAWGSNMFGEVGDGTYRDPITPVPLAEPAGVVAVAAGDMVSFAVDRTGQVWIWGMWDKDVEIEGGAMSWSVGGNRPRRFPGLDDIVAISAGMWDDGALAVDRRGAVWRVEEGERPFDKHRVGGLPRIVAVSQAVSTKLALAADGEVWTLEPVARVSGLPPCRSISAGSWGTCLALGDDGSVWAWDLDVGDAPRQIDLPRGATSISAGDGVSGALLEDGSVWRWKDDTPARVPDLDDVVLFCGGRGGTSLAVDTHGTTWTWSEFDARQGHGVGRVHPVLAPRQFVPGHHPIATVTLAARTSLSPRRR